MPTVKPQATQEAKVEMFGALGEKGVHSRRFKMESPQQPAAIGESGKNWRRLKFALDESGRFCDTPASILVDAGLGSPVHVFVSSRQPSAEVVIMVVRIARVLSAGVVFVLLANVRPAVCEGWSLLHPFSSDTKAETKKTTPGVKTVKKEPSVLEKFGTGTRSFFNKSAETLGLKKPEPKKPQYAYAVPPKVQPPRKKESKSWLGSLFQPEEPPEPKNVSDWMSQNKRPEL